MLAAIAVLLCFTQEVRAQTWYVGSPTASAVTVTLSEGTLTISGTGAMRNFSWNGYNYSIPWYIVRISITNVIIEDGVTTIGEGAFGGCAGLTTIIIGNSVTVIGNAAFAGCTGLTSVTSLNPIPTTIQDYTFGSVDKATVVLYVSEAAIEAYSKV